MHKTERVLPTPTAPHLPPLPAGAERGQFQGISSWGHCETQPENRVSSPGGPGSCGHGSVCCGWQVPQTPRHGQGWSGPLSDPPFPPRFILLLPDSRQALELTQLDCCHSSLEPWPRWGVWSDFCSLSRSRQLNSYHTQLIKCPGGWRSTRGEGRCTAWTQLLVSNMPDG